MMANRKVLLILDSCSAHVSLVNLPQRITLCNTTIHYLPPTMKAKPQPCELGIIRNLKAYYWRNFNRMLLQELDNGVVERAMINLAHAIQMSVSA